MFIPAWLITITVAILVWRIPVWLGSTWPRLSTKGSLIYIGIILLIGAICAVARN